MCGIFGILNLRGNLDVKKWGLPDETPCLQHRGPDDYGFFTDSFVYFGHRRLSIIDLKSGRQPIFNERGDTCVIFNGEIYNFQEIKKILEGKGHSFKSNCDTEVIVHSYEEWGKECVEKFRGMFAFAIWNMKEKELFVARDRLGIKPLYYSIYGDYLIFGSEIKAILSCSEIPRTIDADGLSSFFSLTYIPAPYTIFSKIRKLLPGHTLSCKLGLVTISKYWDISFEPDYSKSEDYFLDGLLGLLEESINLRMVSDVPIGAFLSGGIDSGMIVALMSKINQSPIRTFCMGYGGNIGGHLDERATAQETAIKFNTIHSEYEVKPDPQKIISEITKSFDEPFADSSTIPSYYLYGNASRQVKVALSGLGGDEALGGYERYLGYKLSSFYRSIPFFLREKIVRKIVENLPEKKNGHYTINHMKRFVRSASLEPDARYYNIISKRSNTSWNDLFSSPNNYNEGLENCKNLVLGYFNSANTSSGLDRVFYCDLKTYLPDDILACTDRMSMHHSLEVRVPFLDHKLLEFCASIPHEFKIRGITKKYILKKSAKRYLPKGVLKQRKQGFIGPMTRWIQTDLKNYVGDVLSKKNLNKHGIFNETTVKEVLTEHNSRRENHEKLIWSLIMFQNWYDNYIEGNAFNNK